MVKAVTIVSVPSSFNSQSHQLRYSNAELGTCKHFEISLCPYAVINILSWRWRHLSLLLMAKESPKEVAPTSPMALQPRTNITIVPLGLDKIVEKTRQPDSVTDNCLRSINLIELLLVNALMRKFMHSLSKDYCVEDQAIEYWMQDLSVWYPMLCTCFFQTPYFPKTED